MTAAIFVTGFATGVFLGGIMVPLVAYLFLLWRFG